MARVDGTSSRGDFGRQLTPREVADWMRRVTDARIKAVRRAQQSTLVVETWFRSYVVRPRP